MKFCNSMSTKYASRYEVVFLCTHPKGTKMSQLAAAKYMKKSKSFVQKWVQRYKVAHNVDDLPERGLIGKLDQKDVTKIVNLFSQNLGLTLRQGQENLKQKGLDISCETIRTRLRDNGLKCRPTVKKPMNKHVLRHQKRKNVEKGFSCTRCEMEYRDKSSLKRHIETKHHGRIQLISCPDCPKQYTSKSNLMKHRRKHYVVLVDDSSTSIC